MNTNINFSQNCRKFHLFTKNVILNYNWRLRAQQFLPYKLYGSGLSGIYFFIFASYELLTLGRICLLHVHSYTNLYPWELVTKWLGSACFQVVVSIPAPAYFLPFFCWGIWPLGVGLFVSCNTLV